MLHLLEGKREIDLHNFLAESGWKSACISLITADCSTRQYFRITQDNQTCVLMDSLPDSHPQSSPGHKIETILTMTSYLRRHDVYVPDILASDADHGFVLLEDFGDLNMADVLDGFMARDQEQGNEQGNKQAQGHSEGFAYQNRVSECYREAADALLRLHTVPVYQKVEGKDPNSSSLIQFPDFFDSHVYANVSFFVSWYVKQAHEGIYREADIEDMEKSYRDVWQNIIASMPETEIGLIHGDYHPGNLMVLPGGHMDKKSNLSITGGTSVGVLDFQGAMYGPLAYDVANLVYDARRDVNDEIRKETIDHYCRHKNNRVQDEFCMWVDVMACHFHSRVIGQFIKLAAHNGKTVYLKYLPMLSRSITHMCKKQGKLRPLAEWLAYYKIHL